MEIKTLGDFRKLTKDLDDDFKFDIRIMKEVSKEELAKRSYPYPWDMYDGRMEFHDIGWSDKDFCIGIYENEQSDNIEYKKCEHEWAFAGASSTGFDTVHYYECLKCGLTKSTSLSI